ncbi:hypothetical protein NL676_011655 [Syzygium grande]|nr:hypothetical protein NL676_011655 [Syzygium grande]
MRRRRRRRRGDERPISGRAGELEGGPSRLSELGRRRGCYAVYSWSETRASVETELLEFGREASKDVFGPWAERLRPSPTRGITWSGCGPDNPDLRLPHFPSPVLTSQKMLCVKRSISLHSRRGRASPCAASELSRKLRKPVWSPRNMRNEGEPKNPRRRKSRTVANMGFPSLKPICEFTVPCSKWLSRKSHAARSKCPAQVHVRASRPSPDAIDCSKESRSLEYARTYPMWLAPVSISGATGYLRRPATNGFSPKLPRACRGRNFSPFLASPVLDSRSFASYLGGKRDAREESEVSAVSGAGEVGDGDSVVVSSEWLDKIREAWHGAVDVAGHTGEKVKEVSNELTPYVQQVLDSHPYVKNVFMPIGLTLTGTLLAWVVMPRILRRFHKYATQGQAALLSGTPLGEEVPYDKSFWGALEDPVRYLITFMAFWQIAMMVAPTTVASQYIGQAWRGAVILSFVWFLHRWKTNVFSRALAIKSMAGLDREKMLALDRLSSIGLFVIGLMALAEACGVAVQSIITVGGIGGVATAFAARDILGNVLSGLSMQFSKPFSLGDTIKAGSIEGQVVEMGLTTTSLLSAEKFPVIVPNSLFSSQVIVNKSRAEWRAIVTKIPLQSDDLEKIPPISNDIKNMLKSHPKVFLGKEVPFCFLSQVESSYVELTLGCNLKHMGREEFYTTQQDILLQSVQIIKQHGARLGSRMQEITGR